MLHNNGVTSSKNLRMLTGIVFKLLSSSATKTKGRPRGRPLFFNRFPIYRIDSSTSEIQSGRFSTSRGLGPSAAPTMPSRSIRSMRCAARP